jgi:hypothetical protein
VRHIVAAHRDPFRGIRLPLIVGSALVEALVKDVIKPGDTLAVIGGIFSTFSSMASQLERVMRF